MYDTEEQITNYTTVFEYAREKCHLAILPHSGIMPRDPPAEHVLKYITVSSLGVKETGLKMR